MNIVEINTVDFGSTGKIMLQIAECARMRGYEARTYSIARRKRGQPPKRHSYYSTYFEYCVHYVLGKLTGGNGLFSVFATQRLIRDLRKTKPDIVHLHNLHGFSINLPILFRYLSTCHAHVVWTLHDCWSFTGHCPHYAMVRCKKWKAGCYECPIFRDYPQSDVDNSKWMWQLKKKLFTSVQDITFVTPSSWLANQLQHSFFKDYPAKVIHNGIDLTIFHQTPTAFREQHIIQENKPILLGVAFGWGKRKGLDVFLELDKRFGNAAQIVLVGTDDKIDAQLPPNIISIHRTQNQQELAEIYTVADVFVNPTREEVLGLVNLEALACGTPVITFDTGGSPECIDETCGIVVPCDDVDALEKAIQHVIAEKPFSSEACRQRAEQFDMRDKFAEYVALYKELCNGQQRQERT